MLVSITDIYCTRKNNICVPVYLWYYIYLLNVCIYIYIYIYLTNVCKCFHNSVNRTVENSESNTAFSSHTPMKRFNKLDYFLQNPTVLHNLSICPIDRINTTAVNCWWLKRYSIIPLSVKIWSIALA